MSFQKLKSRLEQMFFRHILNFFKTFDNFEYCVV